MVHLFAILTLLILPTPLICYVCLTPLAPARLQRSIIQGGGLREAGVNRAASGRVAMVR